MRKPRYVVEKPHAMHGRAEAARFARTRIQWDLCRLTSMPHISTRTDENIKRAFQEEARARDMNESKLLDALIASAIGLVPKEGFGESTPQFTPTAATVDPKRFNVRLPEFLYDGAKARAAEKEMSANRWVVALLQSHLTGKPVMTDYEIASLKSSGRELAAIGRNLNQIARALNDSFHETDRVKLELIKDLAAEIKVNRQAIRNLVRASLHAWGVSE